MLVALVLLSGCAPTLRTPIQSDVVSVSGTTWVGTDSDGDYYEYHFMSDGSLHYKSPTGFWKNASWKQEGSMIYMETNNKYTERNGTIRGHTMEGNACAELNRWTPSVEFKMRCSFIGLIILTVMSGTFTRAEELTNRKEPVGVYFGFLNKNGNRILGLDLIKNPHEITDEMCSNSQAVKAEIPGKTKKGTEDYGRQNIYNFDQSKGEFYEVQNPHETKWGGSCFLYNETFTKGRKIISPKSLSGSPADDSILARITKEKGRKIKQYWKLAYLENSIDILVVEFEPKGKKENKFKEIKYGYLYQAPL
jgi:hypothetical protein